MDIGVRNRVVLVTGGSSGIGAAVAQRYGEEGAQVALTYRTNAAAADTVATQIRDKGGDAMTVAMDLNDPASVTAAVDAVTQQWGTVDILVANAVRWDAGGPPDPSATFEDVPLTEWTASLDANVTGVVAAIRHVLPGMRARRWGRVVLVSSSVAEQGIPGPGPYGAAKAALHGLVRTLAWNAGRDGVLVNAVLPGFTLTDRQAGSPLVDRLTATVPSRRLSGADDVARLILFYGSAANANVTGELVRDGSATAKATYVGP